MHISTSKTIDLEFVKYTLMSVEAALAIYSNWICRRVLFISDKHVTL